MIYGLYNQRNASGDRMWGLRKMDLLLIHDFENQLDLKANVR